MRIRFRSKSIRTKLIFCFFMIALVPLLIITGIDTYAPIGMALWSRVLLLFGAGAVVCVIAIFLARSISKPIISMTQAAEKMQAGDFSVRYQMESHDEIGSLARSLNTMADTISSQIAVQRGSAEITETVVTANELQEAIENLLKKLIDLTHSDFGACYIFNEGNNRFENLGSIDISPELLESFKTDIREGQLGKVLSTKSISVIRDIPQDTVFTFKTSTGTVLPREIITVPLIAESRVTAIIALANLNEYSHESIEILDRSWAGMNAATSNLVANDKMRQLTEILNIKNGELQSQAEELQVQSKGLQEQNVELKAQFEQLQEQNTELQVQREQVKRARCLESEFLSNMSHEFRTLLNSTLALSHVLIVQVGERLSEKEGSYLEIIERNGKTLLSLINDILDLSKIETGKMDISAEVFSLGSTIAEKGDREKTLAAGCDDYVSKPFDAEELLTKINSFLSEDALSSLNRAVDHLASEAGELSRTCSDESLVSSEQDEALEDDLALSVQKNRGEPKKCEMQSGVEQGTDLGVCPAATSTAHDGMTGWGAFGKKLRRLITDGVRLRRRKDSSQERYTRRVKRIEKRLRKFIEIDPEDTLPKTRRS